MTCLEKLKLEHPDNFNDNGDPRGCPHHYDYVPMPTDDRCSLRACDACWNVEVDSPIKDSGTRREFSTGAVRDMAENKGDMVSIPWESILRLSRHYENGAKKYARWNFRKGIPVSSFIDSACRHIAKYQCGEDDEDHLSAAAFNILGAMLMENTMPEMQDLPLREGRKTFSYFGKDDAN